jgi:alanyl-tRNA synthetase
VTDANMFDLRNSYHELTGKFADQRWGLPRLQSEVSRLLGEKAAREAERLEAENQKRIEKEILEARIAQRGNLTEFIGLRNSDHLDEEEHRFAYALRRAVSLVEQEANEVEKFANELRKNPTYALSWSKGLFEMTAKAAVARQMIHWFNHGGTYSGWVEEATKEALRKARSPSMSTSPTSNLMETYIAAAWADAVSGWW